MTTALSKFGSGNAETEEEEVEGGGGGDISIENQVEAGLKRSYLESFGEDLGEAGNEQARKRSFKLFKPDLEDPNNPTGPLSTNPNLRNFGPFYQMRDLEATNQGGIVLTKSDDEKTLRLAIGGDSTFTAPAQVTVRPELTAVYRAGNDYVPLYDGEVRFFALHDEPGANLIRGVAGSVALVGKHEDGDYRSHFKLLLRFKLLSGSEFNYVDDPPTYSTTLLINYFDVIAQGDYSPAGQSAIPIGKIKAELRRKSDDELVPPSSTDGDYGYITVSDLLNVEHYVKLWHEEVDLQYDFGDGHGLVPMEPEYTYDVWVADQTLTPTTAISVVEQLGPSSVGNGEPRSLQWGTLPKQVYDIEVALQELTGETVAEVKAQEDLQNSRLGAAEERIEELEKEAGLPLDNPLVASTTPTEETQFPNVRLFQRLQYLDSILRGTSAEASPFMSTNLFFGTPVPAVFSLEPTTVPKESGPNGVPIETVTPPLFTTANLREKGALSLLWTEILPLIQTMKDQLTKFPPYRELRGCFKVGDSDYADLPTEPLHTLGIRAFQRYNAVQPRSLLIPHTTPNLALFRPHPSDPAAEVMRLYHNEVLGEPLVVEYTFNLARTRELLPKGFQLLEFRDGAFRVVPTAIDPSQNHVSHDYLPLDIYSKRSGPNHFIRYIPYIDPTDPNLTVNQPFDNIIFALEQKKYYYLDEQTERDPTTIDIRGGLEKAGIRLDKLEAELDPVYSALRGLHERVASIEHWREAR